jgi:hypothetical protein
LLTEINGRSLVGLSAGQLAAYFREHPIKHGDVVIYRSVDGVRGTALVGDFKLRYVEAHNVTPTHFDVELGVYLRLAAEYRLAEASGTALTDWAKLPADSTPLFELNRVPRNPEDKYTLFIERKIADRLRRFEAIFKLGARWRTAEDSTSREASDASAPSTSGQDAAKAIPEGKQVRERVRIRIPAGADEAEIRHRLEQADAADQTPDSDAGNSSKGIPHGKPDQSATPPVPGRDAIETLSEEFGMHPPVPKHPTHESD